VDSGKSCQVGSYDVGIRRFLTVVRIFPSNLFGINSVWVKLRIRPQTFPELYTCDVLLPGFVGSNDRLLSAVIILQSNFIFSSTL